MSGWIVKRGDQRYGPFTSTQLVEMAKKGQVLPLDWVARGDGGEWMPASQVKGLFAASPQATAAPPPLPATAPSPPFSAPSTINMLAKRVGAIPASIFRPVIGMGVVIALSLLVSFFCGSLLIFLFSFLHNTGALTCVILTARFHKLLYGVVAAMLTMTVWGWFCFTALPIAVSIIGLVAGISIGSWALFTFCSPAVKSVLTEAGKPGPLDRYSTPVLAGAAGGLLVAILGIGGVRYTMTRDRNVDRYANADSSGNGGDRQMKERDMNERTMPQSREMKERTMKERKMPKSRMGGTADEDDTGSQHANKDVTAEDLNNRSFAQIKQLLGQPTEVYRSKKKQNVGLAIWATGNDDYAVVGFVESIDGISPTLVLTRDVNRTRSIVENMKRAIDK